MIYENIIHLNWEPKNLQLNDDSQIGAEVGSINFISHFKSSNRKFVFEAKQKSSSTAEVLSKGEEKTLFGCRENENRFKNKEKNMLMLLCTRALGRFIYVVIYYEMFDMGTHTLKRDSVKRKLHAKSNYVC